MSWQDRQYDAPPRFGAEASGHPQASPPRSHPLGGGRSRRSVVFWLIAINLAVFLMDAVLEKAGLGPLLKLYGFFSADTAIFRGQIWRWVSYQFLHVGLQHVLFNMMGLFFLGPVVERILGARRFLAFYLLCGLAGPAAYLVLWKVGLMEIPADGAAMKTPMIGASACVFGILAACTRIAPNATIYVMMMIPMRLKTFVWLLLGIATYTVIFRGGMMGSNAGGEAAHLGGAALGFVLIYRPSWLDWVHRLPTSGDLKNKAGAWQVKKREKLSSKDREQIEIILQKISRNGLQSLTEKEKDLLQRDTQRLKEHKKF